MGYNIKVKQNEKLLTIEEKVLSYAEDVRDVQLLYKKIKASMKDGHESIRYVIAEQSNRPVEIIDEYLCFGEYLDDHTLNILAESSEGKHFFELVQKVKRILIKNYRHDRLTDDEITSTISEAVLQMFSEYSVKGKVNTKDWQRFIELDFKSTTGDKTHYNCMRKKLKVFKYWSGSIEPAEEQITMNEINKMLKESARRIKNIKVSDWCNFRRQADNLKKEILHLSKVHHHVLELDKQRGSISKRKAA